MAILRQQTAFGPGTYRGRKFDRAKLQTFVDGTNKAIAAGIAVPLLKRHAPINANDTETAQFAKEEGAGWVTKVWLEPETNAIAWEADNAPDDVVKDVKQKTTRFSSPEFRPKYESEKAGVYSGPMIRHFAFTPKPGNPHQGPITSEAMALAELGDEAYQYAEDEKQPLEDLGEQANVENDAANPDLPPKATDKSKMRALTAGMAQLGVILPSDFNLCDDRAIDLMITGLNTAIKAKNDAEAEAAEDDADEDDSSPTDAPMPFAEGGSSRYASKLGQLNHARVSRLIQRNAFARLVRNYGGVHDKNGTFRLPVKHLDKFHAAAEQRGFTPGYHYTMHGDESQHEESQMDEDTLQFTEEELSALPETARKKVIALQEQAAQFEEERIAAVNESARADAERTIQSSKLPPCLKEKLLEGYSAEGGTSQFAEGEELPTYTGVQVAEMLVEALPANLLAAFSEGEDIEEVEELDEQFREEGPAGGANSKIGKAFHVSPEKARALVANSPIMGGTRQNRQGRSRGQQVADENARVPNNVMR